MANEAELIKLFRGAQMIGVRVVEVLHAGVTDEALDEVEALLARRGELLARAAEMMEGGALSGEALATARELAEQQQALEAQVGRAMQAIQLTLQGRQATRENLASFGRVMNPGGRSRMLNQRR